MNKYFVDRISGGKAVLEKEDGEHILIESFILPPDVREGSCVMESDGVYALDGKTTLCRKRNLDRRLKNIRQHCVPKKEIE